MKKIGIIGGGFTGTMTAVQSILKSEKPIELFIVNEQQTFNIGVAYNPYSKKHLLNVIASKMSAFPDQPDHFLNWIMNKNEFKHHDRTIIANSFLPRKIYGEYLNSIWNETLEIAKSKNIRVNLIDSVVTDLDVTEKSVLIHLQDGTRIEVDKCVIATGNNVPRNPKIRNDKFYRSKNYFQNPWMIDSVSNLAGNKPVLIVGNGLTMVDTVLGLLEQKFEGEIFSVSPNGFNILPHRHAGMHYSKFTEELPEKISLRELVKLINKHVKAVRTFGVSAEPIIDSIRPHTQRIWKGLTDSEKQIFMSRLRHLWGVARHRIPLHTHDKIMQLRIEGKLHIHAGKIIDFRENGNEEIEVEYFDTKLNEVKKLNVSRIINCTGPETDLRNLENSFLKSGIEKGILTQDKLKLGIHADTTTFEIFNSNGVRQPNLFTLGSNLKGELWESTAVNELRGQAERLAEKLKD
jgi:uncharacterized NAD(P)/FAD-binding protein YdhS